MRAFFLEAALFFGVAFVGASLADEATRLSPDQALSKLMQGNKTYRMAKMSHPADFERQRAATAEAQHPFAVILGCADSRVPPEVIFDQGIGDLFVVRVAGNIADDAIVGSIEYAMEHLGSSLVVVLGHERCGAVKATLAGGEAPGHLGALVSEIKPSVETTKGQPGDALDNAVRENVYHMVQKLRESKPVLAEMLSEGKLKIVGARYDLDSGLVEFLPER